MSKERAEAILSEKLKDIDFSKLHYYDTFRMGDKIINAMLEYGEEEAQKIIESTSQSVQKYGEAYNKLREIKEKHKSECAWYDLPIRRMPELSKELRNDLLKLLNEIE